MDYVDNCVEEIALEGLDGITLPSLWIRLETRRPTFPLPLDEQSKRFLWRKVIAVCEDVDFYALEEPRKTIVLFDRFQFSDPHSGIILEQPQQEDVYPYCLPADTEDVVLGSCATYHTRRRVTDQIRDDDMAPLLSLEQVTEQYGNRLVIVASLERRIIAIGGEENVQFVQSLTPKIYGFLERIGRARWAGEITQGNNSLKSLKEDPKSLFYVRKILLTKHIIHSQIFNTRLMSQQNTGGLLIHLKKYLVPHVPIYFYWLEKMSNHLLGKPNWVQEFSALRSDLELKASFFKRLQAMSLQMGISKTETVDYREIYPDAPEKKWKLSTGGERRLRQVKLIKPYAYRAEDGAEVIREEDEDEEEGEADEVDLPVVTMEKTIIRQAAEFLRQSGGKGTSQVQLARAFGQNKLEGRLLARYLERMKLAHKVLFDKERQRVYRYVATEHTAKCKQLQKLEREKEKIITNSSDRKPLLDTTLDDSSLSVSVSHIDSALDDSSSHGAAGLSGATSHEQTPDRQKADGREGLRPLEQFIASDQSLDVWHGKKRDAHITYRWLKRANIILDILKDVHIVDQLCVFQKKIQDLEDTEGRKVRPDRKSVIRILQKLASQKEIRIHSTIILCGENEKEVKLYCDNSIERDNPELLSFIECHRQKMQVLRKMDLQVIKAKQDRVKVKEKEDDGDSMDHVPRDAGNLNYALLKSKMSTKDLVYDPAAGRLYGIKPKYRKLEILHKFLWYLIYGYDCELPAVMDGMDFDIVQQMGDVTDQDNPIPDEVLQTFRVYRDDSTWRRFLPRINKPHGFPEGWFQTGDILLVMPVSIFLSIVRTNFKIPGLFQILQDPIRRHLTVSQMPVSIRQALMHDRKYIFTVCEVLHYLSYLGLVASHHRDNREKNQVNMYLYKYTSILDTLTLDTGNTEGRLKKYCLDSYKAVVEFWFNFQNTAINTPIDYLPEVPRQKSKSRIEQGNKLRDMVETKTPDTVWDTPGRRPPGDQLGAAGFDSTLFSHLRRNWCWNMIGDTKLCSLIDSSQNVRRIVQEQATAPGKKGIPFKGGRHCNFVKSIDLNSSKEAGAAKKKRNKQKTKKETTSDPQTGAKATSVAMKSMGSQGGDVEPAGMGKLLLLATPKSPTHGEPQKLLVVDKSKITKIKVEGKPKKGGAGMKRKRKSESEKSEVVSSRKSEPTEPPKKKKVKRSFLFNPAGSTGYSKHMDSLDMEIVSARERERTEWSDEEDSLLLLAEVTQRFMVHPDQRRDVLVSYYFLRDLMREQCKSFADKTSMAVARRLKYIMKNSQTRTNVHVFVGEALQDARLCEKFKAGKKYNKSTSFDELEKSFREIYEQLKERFSDAEFRPVVPVLPNTAERIHAEYIVCPHVEPPLVRWKAPQTKEEICFWVLHNVVHCAMLLHDKIGRSHELFKLFSQYPEELLLAVFGCMKTDGIITKLKKNQTTKSMPWNKIMLASPRLGGYQVSQRYMYHWFSKTYPRAMFEQIPQLTARLHEAHPAGTTPWTVMEDKGGFAALTVALAARRMVRFDTMIPDRIITVVNTSLEEVHARGSQSKAALERRRKARQRTESDEEEDKLIEEAGRRAGEGGGGGGGGGGEESGRAELPETDSHVTFQPSAHATSRSMLNMMHSCAYGVPESQVYHPDNNLVVNGCTVRISLKQPPSTPEPPARHGILHALELLKEYNHSHGWIHPQTAEYLLSSIRESFPPVLSMQAFYAFCREKAGYGESEIDELKDICSKLKARKHTGILDSELRKETVHMAKFEDYIKTLLENYVVVKAGVVEYRYVLYEFARPWLIHTYKSVPGRGAVLQDGNKRQDDVINLGEELPLPAYYPDFNVRSPGSNKKKVLRRRQKAKSDGAHEPVTSSNDAHIGTPAPVAQVTKPLTAVDRSGAFTGSHNYSTPVFKNQVVVPLLYNQNALQNESGDVAFKPQSEDEWEEEKALRLKQERDVAMYSQQILATDSGSMRVFPNLGIKKGQKEASSSGKTTDKQLDQAERPGYETVEKELDQVELPGYETAEKQLDHAERPGYETAEDEADQTESSRYETTAEKHLDQTECPQHVAATEKYVDERELSFSVSPSKLDPTAANPETSGNGTPIVIANEAQSGSSAQYYLASSTEEINGGDIGMVTTSAGSDKIPSLHTITEIISKSDSVVKDGENIVSPHPKQNTEELFDNYDVISDIASQSDDEDDVDRSTDVEPDSEEQSCQNEARLDSSSVSVTQEGAGGDAPVSGCGPGSISVVIASSDVTQGLGINVPVDPTDRCLDAADARLQVTQEVSTITDVSSINNNIEEGEGHLQQERVFLPEDIKVNCCESTAAIDNGRLFMADSCETWASSGNDQQPEQNTESPPEISFEPEMSIQTQQYLVGGNEANQIIDLDPVMKSEEVDGHVIKREEPEPVDVLIERAQQLLERKEREEQLRRECLERENFSMKFEVQPCHAEVHQQASSGASIEGSPVWEERAQVTTDADVIQSPGQQMLAAPNIEIPCADVQLQQSAAPCIDNLSESHKEVIQANLQTLQKLFESQNDAAPRPPGVYAVPVRFKSPPAVQRIRTNVGGSVVQRAAAQLNLMGQSQEQLVAAPEPQTQAQLPPQQPCGTVIAQVSPYVPPIAVVQLQSPQIPTVAGEGDSSASVAMPGFQTGADAVIVDSQRFTDSDCTDITYVESAKTRWERGRAMMKPSKIPPPAPTKRPQLESTDPHSVLAKKPRHDVCEPLFGMSLSQPGQPLVQPGMSGPVALQRLTSPPTQSTHAANSVQINLQFQDRITTEEGQLQLEPPRVEIVTPPQQGPQHGLPVVPHGTLKVNFVSSIQQNTIVPTSLRAANTHFMNQAGPVEVPLRPRVAPATLVQGQRGPIMTPLAISQSHYAAAHQSQSNIDFSEKVQMKPHWNPTPSTSATYSSQALQYPLAEDILGKEIKKEPEVSKTGFGSTADNPIILNVDHSVIQTVKLDKSDSDEEESSKRRIAEFLKRAREMKKKKKTKDTVTSSGRILPPKAPFHSNPATRGSPRFTQLRPRFVKPPGQTSSPPMVQLSPQPVRPRSVLSSTAYTPPFDQTSGMFHKFSLKPVHKAKQIHKSRKPAAKAVPAPPSVKFTPASVAGSLQHIEPQRFTKHFQSLVHISSELKAPIKIELPPGTQIPISKQVKVMNQSEAIQAGIIGQQATQALSQWEERANEQDAVRDLHEKVPGWNSPGTQQSVPGTSGTQRVSFSCSDDVSDDDAFVPSPPKGPGYEEKYQEQVIKIKEEFVQQKKNKASITPGPKTKVEDADIVSKKDEKVLEILAKYRVQYGSASGVGESSQACERSLPQTDGPADKLTEVCSDLPHIDGPIDEKPTEVCSDLPHIDGPIDEKLTEVCSDLPQIDGPIDEKVTQSNQNTSLQKKTGETSGASQSVPDDSSRVIETEQRGEQATGDVTCQSPADDQSCNTDEVHKEMDDGTDSSFQTRDGHVEDTTTIEAPTSEDLVTSELRVVQEELPLSGLDQSVQTMQSCSTLPFQPQLSEEWSKGSRLLAGDSGVELPKQTVPMSSAASAQPYRDGARGAFEKLTVQARPWKTPEGTVNRPVLRMMLVGVLLHVMAVPGVTLARLCDKYNPILQPVAVMDLIQMLDVIGCVKKKYVMKPACNATLFSSRRKLSAGSSDINGETVCYEPTLDCVVKMGQFEAQISENI